MTNAQRTPKLPDQPLWRQGYDALESVIGPPLEQLVGTDEFSRALGVLADLRHDFEQRARRATRRLLHQLNLPAATDVTRLLTEIGELRKQVRQLSEQLDAREQTPTRPTKGTAATKAATKKETTRARARS
jgi:hypothetical protein